MKAKSSLTWRVILCIYMKVHANIHAEISTSVHAIVYVCYLDDARTHGTKKSRFLASGIQVNKII